MGNKKAVYIDMDGTLSRFHDANKMFIEAMWTEGFYANLKPFENMVAAIRAFVKQNPDVDVFVLSAVLDTDPPFVVGEKNAWLDTYLPEIDSEHRIFTKAGEDKSRYINMSGRECYLVDDYNKNLYEFEKAGGHSIKFRNDINHRGLGEYGGSKGELWAGALLNYDDAPRVICEELEKELDVIKKKSDYEIEDDILVDYHGREATATIPDGVKTIGINAFFNSRVKHVVLPDSLKEIESGAFAGLDLKELELPEGIAKIDKSAFLGCNSLKHVDIPASVEFLHPQAFDCCDSLERINVDLENKDLFSVRGIVYKHNRESVGAGGTLKVDAYRCPCGKSGSLDLPHLIVNILPEAFMNCRRLTAIELPENLQSIGNFAFAGCTAVEELEIPKTTTIIGDYAFSGCTDLIRVSIPDGIQEFGHGVFDNCRNLAEVVISDEALVDYCERFSLLDEVFMTSCYEELKERYDSLTKGNVVDRVLADATERSADTENPEYGKDFDKEMD